MRLTAEVRRQQIVDVALELFARQGFEGTTTREIAERAGINEALLFRHFPTKDRLYSAVLEESCRVKAAKQHLAESLEVAGEDEEIFANVAESYLRRNRNDSSISRLLLFSALEGHRLSPRLFQKLFGDYFEMLAAHVRRRIDEGAFRNLDPVMAARAFAGMVVYHHLVQDIFGGRRFQKYDEAQTARLLARLWLHGVTAGERRAPVRKSISRNGTGKEQ